MQMSSFKPCRFHAICATAITLAFVVSGQMVLAVDGDLDPTFGTDGKVLTDFDHSTDIANAVAIQADGKLVVVGTTYQDNDFSNEDFAVARYNPDGTLDKTFGAGGKVQTDFPGLAAVASSVVIQPDGKIVVAGGAFPLFTFLGDFKVVRYNPNGSLDTSFGDGGIVTTTFPEGSYAFDVALQTDGKIIAAGTVFVDFDPGESSNTDFALARYNPDGTPDATFGNGGQVSTDFVGFEDDAFSVLIQPDGKIVAVGSANDPATFYDFAAVRYLSNGTLDTTFGVAGKVHTDFGDQNFDRARSAALQPDGRIVAAGFAISQNGGVQNFAVARYDSSGVLDTNFGTRRDNANRLRQLLPECYQSSAAKQWQNHHRRRFERRVIRGRLFVGASDSDRCARSHLWRWRQSPNFLWRSERRSQRRRFSARWEDCGCRFPSDRPRAVR